jgi:hypothetical protein
MHRFRCRSVPLIATTLLALTCASLVASPQDKRKKVQVYILAGQSNMEGKGFPEPIAYQVTQAKYRDRYAHFIKGKDFASFAKVLNASIAKNPKQPVYNWSVREDVWVNYLDQRGNLTVGFAAPRKCFGPEYNFGHVMGDHFDGQVLIIKTAWGGKSLGRDFRSPSSNLPSDAEFEAMAQQQNTQIQKHNARNKNRKPRPLVTAADIKKPYGHFYREMLREVKGTLSELKTRFPKYKGQGYELRGFVWFQGWNDQFNREWATNYGKFMANFIRDVRRDLDAPKLPFVIGQIGFNGMQKSKPTKDGKLSNRDLIKRGQLAMAKEFPKTVRSVKTDLFWDMDAEAIYRGPGGWSKDVDKWRQFGNERPYHYYGSPWFFAQAGEAFGKAMLEIQ